MASQRGMPATFEIYNGSAFNLTGKTIQVAGNLPDTHRIHEIRLEYIFDADSSDTNQASLFFEDLPAKDAFIDAFFAGSSSQPIDLYSPDLGNIIAQEFSASELVRLWAAAAEVYPECPILQQYGVSAAANKVVAFPLASRGEIRGMRLEIRIPFAFFNRLDIRDTMAPFAGQFQGGGLKVSPPGATFSDGTNTWTFDQGNTTLRVLAVARPSGVKAGKASPIRWMIETSTDKNTKLTNDMAGLILHLSALGNDALQLEQAGANGRYEVVVDGLTLQPKNPSSPTFAKSRWAQGLRRPEQYLAAEVPMTPSSATVTTNDGSDIDLTATRDVPLISFGEADSLVGDVTISAREVQVNVNSEWVTQTPELRFGAAIVWQRSRINGSSSVACCADGKTSVDATGRVVAPPSGAVSEDLIPFLPAIQPIA